MSHGNTIWDTHAFAIFPKFEWFHIQNICHLRDFGYDIGDLFIIISCNFNQKIFLPDLD